MISFVKHCSARALTVARAHYNLKRLTTNVPPYSQSLCQPTRPRPRTNVIRNGPRPHAHTQGTPGTHCPQKRSDTKPATLNPAPALRRCCPLHTEPIPHHLTAACSVCVCSAMLAAHTHTHTSSSHPAHELLHVRDRRRRAAEELELRAGGEGELGVACLLSQVACRQLEGCSLQ